MLKDNPIKGASYLWQGFQLLGNPKLRLFLLIPILINTIIFACLLFYTLDYINSWIDSFFGWIPDWLNFMDWIIWPFLITSVLLICGYLSTIVAILIASPFNSLLAEKAEELLTGQPVDSLEGFYGAIRSFPLSIGRELKKILYYAPLLITISVLSFIPPITLIAPLLWFFLGAWMMSVQYCDYPLENNCKSFDDIKYLLRQKRLTSLGFGGIVSLISAIPVINFVVMPAAVCGAVIYWCEELKSIEST
jgi:CysZ protein